jgi:hypothetical protein
MGNFLRKSKINEETDDVQENFMALTVKKEISDSIFPKYYEFLKVNHIKNYKENRNNQTNISLSLDKKGFDSLITTKKVFLNKKKKFVYWKDFLLKYLNKKVQEGYKWAEDLSR